MKERYGMSNALSAPFEVLGAGADVVRSGAKAALENPTMQRFLKRQTLEVLESLRLPPNFRAFIWQLMADREEYEKSRK